MAEDIKLSDCPVKGQIDRNATYNGKSWQIRIKCFDENGEVDYKLKKGFLTADEANDAKEAYDKELQTQLDRIYTDNEKMKLKVNIEMFGRETATELDFDQVDKLL